MNFNRFIESTKRLAHASSKPSRDEVWLLLKISILGIGLVGGIGFMVRILFFLLGTGSTST